MLSWQFKLNSKDEQPFCLKCISWENFFRKGICRYMLWNKNIEKMGCRWRFSCIVRGSFPPCFFLSSFCSEKLIFPFWFGGYTYLIWQLTFSWSRVLVVLNEMRGVSDTKWPGHLIAGTRAIWYEWLSSNRAAAVHSLEQIYKVDWHFFWLSLTFVWGQSHRLLVLERALMKEISSILLIFSACFVLQAEPDVTGTQHTWLPKLPAFPTL